MNLSIEDPEGQKLAQLLADETGETIAVAVTQALRERVERIHNQRKKQAMLAKIAEIGRRSAAVMQGPAVDHAELLCDEKGLPK